MTVFSYPVGSIPITSRPSAMFWIQQTVFLSVQTLNLITLVLSIASATRNDSICISVGVAG